jgi:hypothetical protein
MPAHLRSHSASRPGAPLLAFACGVLALLLALAPRPAAAGDVGATFLTWWACPGDRHAAPGVPFDCLADGGTVYTLVGTFALASDVSKAVSMDADVNIAFPGLPVVPNFWEIDLGGCNPSSFNLVKGMPQDCGGHLNAFCGGDSNLCDLVYSAFVFPNSNVLRLSITAGRDFFHTVDLKGGQRYFAFAINIPMYGAANCIGCTTPCAIGFSKATIYSIDAAGQLQPPATVSGSYPGAIACATANDGFSECVTVPVRRLTWGRLKSLYR